VNSVQGAFFLHAVCAGGMKILIYGGTRGYASIKGYEIACNRGYAFGAAYNIKSALEINLCPVCDTSPVYEF